MNYWDKNLDVSELLGKTLTSIEGCSADSDEVLITLDDGTKYRMYHDQDCCEGVSICDVVGDPQDLIGSPLTMAEEVTSAGEDPPDAPKKGGESFTWTYYKFATLRGYVTIRWYGESNGYYSESVSFVKV